ncbi:pentafunctional AROM polypeptide [Aspergillus nomiae NRRL 13137]|uniref:Pentafunctional AROM polypeptide n=1 Tax=Aspergillus nomiae NRRL (strain ATCC 15546 / NRRL 13137 / CBS 260.88 / M93) TaxID=1509407 RepID=A0A0L1JDC7_ASPN3|nr:pentafunctional AROM polypeptide [Aspergillus nomiae NRRL 13137]KNG89731.1 pentafunctional AROM polypeptide [Aspergillus nomiae NRRL 13137]
MSFHVSSSNAHHNGLPSSSRRYSSDASLALVGFPGAGKKTLGIMAAVALRRRLVDFVAFFQQRHGMPPHGYIAAHGSEQYRKCELEVTEEILTEHRKGCVIVGLGWLASRQQQVLLEEFASCHPVLYIRRDRSDLQQLIATSQDKFERMWEAGNAFFESCSSLEFYNVTEGSTDESHSALPAYLKLKETERTFVRFLHRIWGREHRTRYSADPFSASYTYALQLPMACLEGQLKTYDEIDNGADAINLKVELLDLQGRRPSEAVARAVAMLRRHSRALVIVDIIPSSVPDIKSYRKLLGMILRTIPDAITCSLACGDDLAQEVVAGKGYTKAIATYHQECSLAKSETLPELVALRHKAQGIGFDAFQITGESTAPGDNFPGMPFSHSLARDSLIPTIAYDTGLFGRTSVCLNPTLSPVVLETMRSTGVTLREAEMAVSACFLRRKKKFGIFGQQLSHTLSPAMHNAAYAACGLPYTYGTAERERLSDIREFLDDESYGGVAVTLPYKTEVLPYLDEISPDALDINAVNTVVLHREYQPNGVRKVIRKGYNTDYLGIQDCIYKHLSPANAIRDGSTALIIGAGGMAHAAIYASYQLGVRHICVYNRTLSNAQRLVDYYRDWVESKNKAPLHLTILSSPDDPWPAHLRQPTIIVSCIPGQRCDIESSSALRIADQWLQSKTGGVFVEVAYDPLETRLIKSMREHVSRGWIIVDGLSVLVEQGIAQYELFTNRPAPVHVMRRAIQQSIRDRGV